MSRWSTGSRRNLRFGTGVVLVLATLVWAGFSSAHRGEYHQHSATSHGTHSHRTAGHEHDGTGPAVDAEADEACTCATARVHNGWCKQCKIGYVAGTTIPSYYLFEALDAHGHMFDPDRFTCETCLAAMPADGYCESHRLGFVEGKLYFSELTWSLARGRAIDPGTLNCALCRKHANHQGWCEACEAGQVGSVRFTSRSEYDRASRQWDRLGHALDTLGRCEECAMRTFYPGVCSKCRTDSRTLPGALSTEEEVNE